MSKSKTVTIYESRSFDGTSKGTAFLSISKLLDQIERKAEKEGREVLYDTMEISIERERIERRTLAEEYAAVTDRVALTASAMAVLK